MKAPRVVPYGPGAVFVDLRCDDAVDRAARTLALAAAIRGAWPEADVVVGAGTLVIVGVSAGALPALPAVGSSAAPLGPRSHTVAAVYDGPDLAEVGAAAGLHVDEVIARHTEVAYGVELVGFLPGFAYLGAPPGWPLALPRRPSPRPRVPAGSIGIAAAFSAVYPFASPGGWNLIARAVDVLPFDATRDPPVLFQPGDRVRFVPVSAPPEAPSPPIPAPRAPPRGLLVVSAPACATVQDRGRAGQLGRGIPPSGPLDVEAFAAANAALGNPPDAAVVEVPLGAIEVEARGGPVRLSVDGEPARDLHEGERLRIVETDRAVRYLAVAGGVDVPVVLGARATLLAARLGGHLGRPLRRGDVLAVGAAGGSGSERVTARAINPGSEALLVDPGPHLNRFPPGAYEALLAGPWRVSRLGDRTGVRLEGARVPREGPDLALPAPMIRGAVQSPPTGRPSCSGRNHPTTGGYPVLAVLRPASQAALARRRPGAPLRFADGGLRA